MDFRTQIIKGTPSAYVDSERTPERRTLTTRPPSSQPPRPDGDNVDLLELWGILRKNVGWILLTGILTFAAVMAHTMRSDMEFVSSGRLFLGELSAKSASADNLNLSGDTQSDLASEMEILKSRTLVMQAILKSGLNVEVRHSNSEPMSFYDWLRSGRDLDRLDAAAQELSAIDTSLPAGERSERSYEVHFASDTMFELLQNGKVVARAALGEPLSVNGMNITLLPGTQKHPVAGSRYDIHVGPLNRAVNAVMANLELFAPKGSGGDPAKVVTLTFSHGSPFFAAKFLVRLMESYLVERQAWKTEDATAAEAFVSDQLKEMRESLHEIEDKLAEFRTKNRVVVLENEAEAMVQQIAKFDEQRVSAKLEIAALEGARKQLDQAVPSIEAFMLGEAPDPLLQNLAQSLSTSSMKLKELRSQFKEAAPSVQTQRTEVKVQKEAIKGYLDNRLARARNNLSTLSGVIGQYEGKLRTVPGAEQRLAQLSRESDVYSSTYSFLLQQQQKAAMVKASNVSKNRILDQPQVVGRESSPKLALRMASGPLGLILGALSVLVLTFFSGKLQSVNDVKRVVGRIPVLACVPQRLNSGNPKKSPPVIDANTRGLNVGFVEAIRTLRTNLYYMDPAASGTVVLFSSPTPGDGKTTCSLALASMLAADGKKVLVIDADLRKPSHHLLLNAGNTDTQAESAPHSEGWEGAAHPITGSFGTFHSLRANEDAPAELLSGPKMSRFLAHVRAAYDYILLDCAAYPLVSDALMLAAHADFSLSVLRLNKTKRQHTEEHLRGIARSGTTQAVIINDVNSGGRYGNRSYPSKKDRLSLRGRDAQPPSPRTTIPPSVRDMFI